jgi:thioredoxin-related protein
MTHRTALAHPVSGAGRLLALAGLLAATLLAAPAVAAGPTAGQDPGLTWLDHDAALTAAAEQERPVMLHFTADWCRWCKKMKAETYTDPAVAELLREDFVTGMIDADENPGLKTRYGVEGLPTIWFLTASGDGITYVPGFVPAETFATLLRWVASGAYTEQPFEDFAASEG